MIELGKIQKLTINKETSQGIYLNDENEKDHEILLPKNDVPSGIQIGDEIEVFVYRDSEDRWIATTERPKIIMYELSMLKVVDKTKIGAFLDWGLPKDLFLPFKEQNQSIKKGNDCLVGLYVDKSNRLCATMNISKLLKNQSPYQENDKVKGTIYSINREIGAFVAVEDQYQGLIPMREFYGHYKIGDKVEAEVIKIKKDGKLDLRIRKKAYKEIDKDAEKILNRIINEGGNLDLNDNSSPEKIKKELQMSKRAFKRAVGRLLKLKKIEMKGTGIQLIRKE